MQKAFHLMRHRYLWLFFLVTISTGFLTGESYRSVVAQAAAGQSDSFFQQTYGNGKAGKLTPRLQLLAEEVAQQSIRSAQDEADLLGVTEAGPGSLLKNIQGTPLVYIRLTDISATTLAALQAVGADIVDIATEYQTVTAHIAPSQLGAVAELSAVLSLQEEFTPLKIDSVDLQPSAAPTAPTVCPGGSGISEGDVHLRAATARTQFGVAGTGISIGVLSDSFDRNTSPVTRAAQDITTGDLPGPNNPCGFLTPVRVLAESTEASNSDEGRAMLQIVHDLAPNANLQFATVNGGMFAFAQKIRDLRTAGADILVDDVIYLAEPYFQDGPISVAAADVAKQGALYFTAAGNSNLIVNGQAVGSYETPAFRPMSCPAGFPTEADKCHDFNPGSTADNDYSFTLAPDGGIAILLQWAQPWYGVTTDYDLLLLNQAGNIIVAAASANKTTQIPFDGFGFVNRTGSTQTYRIVIARYRGPNGVAGDDKTPRFKLITIDSLNARPIEYNTSVGGDIVGPTVFGHSATAGAISVGAVPYTSTTALETFSAHGPATLYFGPVQNNTAAALLNLPQVLNKPDIAATDNVVTTFFGQQSRDGKWRFRGTSAAAPHAAAVAALLLEHGRKLGYRPSLDSMEFLLETSVRPLTGSLLPDSPGLIDAVAAITTLQNAVPTMTLPVVGTQSVPRGQSVTLVVTATGALPLSYQWYEGNKGDTTKPVGNGTGPSLLIPAVPNTVQHWVRITNAHGSVDSPTFTTMVTDPPTPTPTSTATACPTDTVPTPGGCATITPTSTPTTTPTPTLTPTPTATASPTPITPGTVLTTHQTFLLFIANQRPPTTPLLQGMVKADTDNNFTVTWNAAEFAESYTLEEANNQDFVNVVPQYIGAATTWTAGNKAPGVYYYRVRASNPWGVSKWSNIERAQVLPPDTFYPNADSTVLQGLPTDNFGDTIDMWVGYDDTDCHPNPPGGKISQSLLQFDLTAIPPNTPIVQALVHVRLVNACWGGSGTRTVTSHRISNAWDETTVTWATKPNKAESSGSFGIALDQIGPNEYTVDITNLVRGWVNGQWPNHGLLLSGPEKSGRDSARFGFGTRDSSNQYQPYLTLIYEGASQQVTVARTTNEDLPLDCLATAQDFHLCNSSGVEGRRIEP